ncbi:MAG: HlyC/CorC family transporter [Caulobacteraceae bacterium]|nr:HlyC/CorC family transporter [Caulobacteraceae bacterium]
MTLGAWLGLALILILLLALSGLISAAETAMTGASRARLHQLEREGDRAATRVNRLLGDRESMIGAILLAYNIINILASSLTTSVLGNVFPGALGVAIATASMTVLIVVFAEILPKTVAITRPDGVARFLSWPVYWVVKLLSPVVNVAQWIVRLTLRPFGVKLDMAFDVLAAHEEIKGAIEYHHSEGLVEGRDRQMLGGVLDLSDLTVEQVMVHRKSVLMLDADLPISELIAEALEIGHTRIPLYRENPENIVGVLHARDLMRAMADAGGKVEKIDVAKIMHEPWFIPEATNLKDQLQAFLKTRRHFALVVDEYGALMGLVTLEDILEEIVGEIDDEHDAQAMGVRRQPDGSVHVDGQAPIRDLNRAMDWDLPEDDAVTVAGLVIHEAETIPEPGQTFMFHGHRFQVLRRRNNQITGLKVWPKQDRPA